MPRSARLAEYRRKRNFRRTPEPAGVLEPPRTGRSFVIQRHHARRLHYDFRLELEGVLKSWAVPKGPSLDPRERRLAVHVEDHPIEYGSFEGVIPAGEYGGGRVYLWDRGQWIPDGDPAEDYRRGRLGFYLKGAKLHGHWTLVAMGGSAGEHSPPLAGSRRNWLLIKTADAEAKPASEGEIVDERPESVGPAPAGPPRVWRSHRGPAGVRGRRAPGPGRSARSARSGPLPALSKLPGARGAPLPARVDVELATLVDEVPAGGEWIHELKLDGYRIVARLDGGAATLHTRRWNDWTSSFPSIVEGVAALPARQAVLDGELVVLDERGASSFQALQNALSLGTPARLHYYVFDVLYLDGYDLRGVALWRRKEVLRRLLASPGVASSLRYTDHIEAAGPEFFRETCAHQLEGIVSKRRDAPYRAGRGPDWVKVKCLQEQEFVVGGFTDPLGGRRGFGSLALGYYRGRELVYCGNVGTGFTEQLLADLDARLRRLETSECPFKVRPPGRTGRATHWVRPALVAQVTFSGWTDDGSLRQPSFQGLREDKAAAEVVREEPEHLRSRSPSSPEPDLLLPTGGESSEMRGMARSTVKLSNPDRVLYPEQGITKQELARYYEAVASRMLPHVARRPIALVRCPEGRGKPCFYQKHVRESSPPALRPVDIQEKGETQTYFYIEDLDGLISLVQMGALEIHPWGCRVDDLEKPDLVVFDLDPAPDVGWDEVVEAAFELRETLADLGLRSWAKTTGGKGLHVIAPLAPRLDFDAVKAFSKRIAEELVRREPGRYTAKLAKSARPGKIFIDYLRNGRGSLAVAPYSTRARAGAPVATPLTWAELRAGARPDRFTLRTIPARLAAQRKDPWEGFLDLHQTIPVDYT